LTASGVHEPSLPPTSQAWQVPEHALLQQYPSTHKPEAQSPASAQVLPLAFLVTHSEPLQ